MNEIIEKLRKFNSDRDWEQFHTPKNIAMALSVEASEIVEIFQWLTSEQSKNLCEKDLIHLKEEIGDVFQKAKGLAKKYNEL